MFSKIQEIEDRFNQLESELARSEVVREQKTYQKYMKEHRALAPIVEAFRKYQTLQHQIENNRSILDDPDQEIRKLAKEEIERLKTDLAQKESEIKVLLLPQDPNDEKNIILEIRAGTGGDEAGLFANDLFRMYLRYAELKGWKTEIMSLSHSGLGGLKEVILLIAGDKVYSRLKHEGGVHRVQRVPETEAQGRIHTSAVTVAVLPEAEDVDVQINSDDLRIDVYRSSGRGGQHVNVTDSAVRITHLPTGLVVACQDERSQHKNKAKAMKVLRSRLLDREQTEQQMKISEERRSMVGSGDRSEKIRTYNYPQGRVTDHRIGLTIYRLDTVLQGQMDLILDPLITHFQAEVLKADQPRPLADQRGPLANQRGPTRSVGGIMSQKSWTVGELLKVTADYLRNKKIESPRLNAEVLLAHQLQLDRIQLYLNLEQPLNEKEVSGYRSLVKRRVNREPLQHVTGTQEFWSLDFTVGPQVLVPRPETEVLVEKIIELHREKCLGDHPKILDLGTGSGVIAVVLARDMPGAEIWATDISRDALDLAILNSQKHGVKERIHFLSGDMFEALDDQGIKFEVIASNPPYIPSDLLDSLAPEVRDHEPRLALDGGQDGMRFVTTIIKEAADHLAGGGWLAVEMDPDQTVKAMKLIEQSGRYSTSERVKDYSRRYRVIMAQKK